jgi:hypothetical protein
MLLAAAGLTQKRSSFDTKSGSVAKNLLFYKITEKLYN